MHNLARIIGPAPSEMSLEELEKKLSKERERVTAALEAYKQSYSPGRVVSSKKKEPSDMAKIKKAAADIGISVEEYIELAKEVMKEKGQLSLNLKEADNGEENDRDSSLD